MRFTPSLGWGGWALIGALTALVASTLAAAWGWPPLVVGLGAGLGVALLAAGLAWALGGGLSAQERAARRRWQQRHKAKLAKARDQIKALQAERQRLQRDLERAQAAVRRAQREASQALARASRAEQQARHWQAQAQAHQQRAQALAQQVAELEAARQRAERAKGLLEAVHRLETWEGLPEVPAEAGDLAPDELAQRLREAIHRLREERDTAFGMAREAEDALQYSRARLAALQGEVEAYKARLAACEEERRAAQARWQRVLHDLLDPQTDIVAVPVDRWQTIAAYHDQRRAWDALLTKLRRADQRHGQTKALPGGGGGFVFPRGRQTRRVLFFEQPLQKRVLWVCRLWDAHEDDREYETLTTQGASREDVCPDPTAFTYWTPSASASA